MKGNIMENIKIKDYIINNFKDDNQDTLRNAIEQSIKENDEVVLPGMGVFLSLIWNGSDEDMKKRMLDTLYNELQKNK